MASPARSSEEKPMTLDYAAGGVVAALILVYLVYALVRPERF
jgi:K+-transporting ATPase KdpF subunit